MIVVPRHHQLGLAEAKRLAEGMARGLQHEHGGTYSWTETTSCSSGSAPLVGWWWPRTPSMSASSLVSC